MVNDLTLADGAPATGPPAGRCHTTCFFVFLYWDFAFRAPSGLEGHHPGHMTYATMHCMLYAAFVVAQAAYAKEAHEVQSAWTWTLKSNQGNWTWT
jgi:hypothetical protein